MIHCILIKFSIENEDTVFLQSCQGCWDVLLDADTWHLSWRLILVLVTLPLSEALLLSPWAVWFSSISSWMDGSEKLTDRADVKALVMQYSLYLKKWGAMCWARNKSEFLWQQSASLPTKVRSVEAKLASLSLLMYFELSNLMFTPIWVHSPLNWGLGLVGCNGRTLSAASRSSWKLHLKGKPTEHTPHNTFKVEKLMPKS